MDESDHFRAEDFAEVECSSVLAQASSLNAPAAKKSRVQPSTFGELLLGSQPVDRSNAKYFKPYLYGRPTSKSTTLIDHFLFSKLNRCLVPPESEVVPLDDGPCADPGLEDYFDSFGKFPVQLGLPLPLRQPTTLTPQSVLRGIDAATDLVERKTKAARIFNLYKKRLKNKTTWCKNAAERTLDELKEKERELLYQQDFIQVPKDIARIAEAVQADPDPYFVADYNWYPTGGALACGSVGDQTVLFYAGGENLSSLVATPVMKRAQLPTGCKLKSEQIHDDARDEGPIFEISAHDALAACRQKTLFRVLRYSRDEDPRLTEVVRNHTLASNSFTSVQLSHFSNQYCLTSTRTRKVRLWDLNTGRAKTVHVPTKSEVKLPDETKKADELENWSQGLRLMQWNKAHFGADSERSVLFTDESSVILLDTRKKSRSPLTVLDIRQNASLFNELLTCETICNCFNSLVNPQVVYVATSHCLFGVDLRRPNVPLQSWKHCLSRPPVFVSQSCYAEGRELLVLASSAQKEVVGITNEWPAVGGPYSRAQPLLLPSTINTLKEAHKLGLGTSPNVIKRMEMSRVGLCTKASTKPIVFSLNSAGDLFCQRLTTSPGSDISTEDSRRFLEPWCEAVKKIDRTATIGPVKTTTTFRTKHLIKKVINKKSDPEPAESPLDESAITNPPRPWVLSTEELFESTDLLAPRLLNAWGISSSADWEAQRVVALGEEGEATFSQKISLVEQWLAASNVEQEPVASQSAAVPETQTEVLTQELVSVSQDPFASAPIEIGQEAATDKDVLRSKLITKYANVVKKKRRKDGF